MFSDGQKKKLSKKVKPQRNKKQVKHKTGYSSKELSMLHQLAKREVEEDSEYLSQNMLVVDDEEEDVMFSDNEEDVVNWADSGEFGRNQLTVSLRDALHSVRHTPYNSRKSTVMSETPQAASGQNVKRKGKGEAIYIDDPDFWQDFPVGKIVAQQNESTETGEVTANKAVPTDSVATYVTHQKNDFKPVVVRVIEGSIHPDTLKSRYQENYMEGHSHPRRFVVKLDPGQVSPLQESFVVFSTYGPNNNYRNDDDWTVGDDGSFTMDRKEIICTENQVVKLR